MKTNYTQIKTFDDACRAVGTTETAFNEKFQPLGLDADTLAYEKLKVIARAINGNWKPDFENWSQEKWFPIFALSAGLRDRNSDSGLGYAYSSVGSRLCFESEEKSNYAASQFKSIWEQFLL